MKPPLPLIAFFVEKELVATRHSRSYTEVVPIVRTGFSGFLACLFPYQAAFKSPSRYQVSGVLPSRLLWGRAWL